MGERISINEGRERRIRRYINVAKELRNERPAFPGIDSDTDNALKAIAEEFPDRCPPIDELIQRFKNQGIKVVFGKDPNSGNVFLLPAQSEDIEMDSLFPRHLREVEGMDPKLKELVRLNKETNH